MNLSFTKLPWYAQIGIFVGVSAAALGVFYNFYASPVQAEMAVREEQLAVLRTKINRGLATARQLPQFRRDVEALESRLDSLRAVLPEEKDVADLLRRIQTLATQSNLTIKGFKPEPMATKQLHAEWPITLQIDGTYHNLGMFFDRISKFSRIINVSAVDIRAKDRPGPGSTISAQCVATTFVLLDTKTAPPAAVKAGR